MEKLYYQNPYIKSFEAAIVKQMPYDGKTAVILDQTAFYPEGGGQPADGGTINGFPVIHVLEAEGEVLHILEKPLEGSTAICTLDWDRRFDHMQQHTGQHILSACFDKVLGGVTNSFHLGREIVSIEIDITEFDDDKAAIIENMANEIIYKNLPIKAYFVEPEELSALPLRKMPKVSENIRIVEVDKFDYSPCGGTHLAFTGEVGIIKIRRYEKLKDCCRFEFVCGKRALEDYRFKNKLAYTLGSKFSARDVEVEGCCDKLINDYAALNRQLIGCRQELLAYESEKLLADAVKVDHFRVISRILDNRDVNDLKLLSQNITKSPGTIALLACRNSGNNSAQVVFARSEDAGMDMGQLLKSVNPIIEGKGGGSSKMAQGGGPKMSALQEFMDTALNNIKRSMV